MPSPAAEARALASRMRERARDRRTEVRENSEEIADLLDAVAESAEADRGRIAALENVADRARRCIDLLSFNFGGAPTLAATNPQLAARDALREALDALERSP